MSKPKPKTASQGYLVASTEPAVPTVHIERGSGGEYRYGVRVYAATAEKARLDAVRQFLALEAAVQEIRGTIHVKS